jgi:hypothetical protein
MRRPEQIAQSRTRSCTASGTAPERMICVWAPGLSFKLLDSPLDGEGRPIHCVSCFASRDENHAVVRCVLQPEQALQLGGELGAVLRSTSNQVDGAAMVIAAVQAAQAQAAYSIRRGDPGKDCHACRYVPVLAGESFPEHGPGNVEVRLSCRKADSCFVCAALRSAHFFMHFSLPRLARRPAGQCPRLP